MYFTLPKVKVLKYLKIADLQACDATRCELVDLDFRLDLFGLP